MRSLLVKHPFIVVLAVIAATAILAVTVAILLGLILGAFSLFFAIMALMGKIALFSPLITIALISGGIAGVAATLVLTARPGARKNFL